MGPRPALSPRDAWCAITVEAGEPHTIDPRSATLGNNGNPNLDGGHFPGRVGAVVFIPREWQPDPGSPPVPVPWDDTLRNALESYLFHKHRFALPRGAKIPPDHGFNHAKMDLVENLLGLPRAKINGSIFLVR